jgi:enoyl-CoA hydratase
MTDYTTIIVEQDGAVGRIIFNRPQVLNAMTNAMMDEFDGALTQFDADPGTRVVIVTGAGRAFCAGRDKNEIGQSSHRTAADVWLHIEQMRKPVIAAVNGLCYTGALSMVLCFDLVIASEKAVFADTHARFGMYHGGGATQRLRSAVGPLKAKEILFTSQPVDAAEALRIGLVNRVVPADRLDAEVAALAATIAANNPDAIRAAKQSINVGVRWGSAVGFDQEAREYRAQRQAVVEGTAKIEVTTANGKQPEVVSGKQGRE